MRDIIKKILTEEYKKMSLLPRNIVISIYDLNITLYDYENEKIFGFVGLSQGKNGTYYFPMIAAEKGFGPTILEIALMFCHPNGLMVSRDGDIRGEAYDMWIKMYHRPDVIKETLPLKDKNFNFAIITGEDDDMYDSEFEKMAEFEYHIEDGYKENILIYNTKMSMEPTKDYQRLLDDGILLDHRRISSDGRDYFSLKYNQY